MGQCISVVIITNDYLESGWDVTDSPIPPLYTILKLIKTAVQREDIYSETYLQKANGKLEGIIILIYIML